MNNELKVYEFYPSTISYLTIAKNKKEAIEKLLNYYQENNYDKEHIQDLTIELKSCPDKWIFTSTLKEFVYTATS